MFDLYVVTDAGLSGGRSDAEVARLDAFTRGVSSAKIRSLVAEGMDPRQALAEARRALREEGEIPLNREVRPSIPQYILRWHLL